MECGPAARPGAATVIEVVPPESVPVPSATPPSAKATVPSGIPKAEVTVAVMVNAFPYITGIGENEITVVVLKGACTT